MALDNRLIAVERKLLALRFSMMSLPNSRVGGTNPLEPGALRGGLARPSFGIIPADLPHKCEIVHIGEKNWKGVGTRRLKHLSIALPT